LREAALLEDTAVAGARVSVLPAKPRSGSGDDATTDLEGRFVGQLGAEVEIVSVVIQAPGMALRVFEFPFDDLEVRLPVRPGGGTVVLDFGNDFDGNRLGWSLFQEGRYLPGERLLQWIQAHGVGFTLDHSSTIRLPGAIPALTPGRYELCTGPPEFLFEPGPGRKCAGGVLVEGERLELAVPEGSTVRP
jgi:hypothetical protein